MTEFCVSILNAVMLKYDYLFDEPVEYAEFWICCSAVSYMDSIRFPR